MRIVVVGASGGSVTLTSGMLSREPMPGSAAISLVNAGIEGFVRAAALEMPDGVRVNAVSPPLGERDAGGHGTGWFRGYACSEGSCCLCGERRGPQQWRDHRCPGLCLMARWLLLLRAANMFGGCLLLSAAHS